MDIAYTAYCQEDYLKPITDKKDFTTIDEVVEFFGVSEAYARIASNQMHRIQGVQEETWYVFKSDIKMFEVEAFLGEKEVKEFYRR